MKIEVKSITQIRKGRFVVSYTKTSACGCSTIRNSFVWDRKTKPTEEQAKKKINEVNDQQ